VANVPYDIQDEARARILAATRADADSIECTARRFSPTQFYT
jgi:hypothetical protein